MILNICWFRLMFHMEHIISICYHIILHVFVKLVTKISNKLKDITCNYKQSLTCKFPGISEYSGSSNADKICFSFALLSCLYRLLTSGIVLNDFLAWKRSQAFTIAAQNKRIIFINFVWLLKFCFDTSKHEKCLHMHLDNKC